MASWPRKLKKDFAEKNGKRFAHPVFHRRSVLQRTGKHPTSLHEADRSDGRDRRTVRIDLHDFGTTFKAYRREIIQEIQLYGELHRFIPALASSTGARITEVPIENLERKNGRSNYGIGRTIRVFLDLIIVKFLLDYSTRPLQFFGLLGVAGAGLGSLLACFLAYEN